VRDGDQSFEPSGSTPMASGGIDAGQLEPGTEVTVCTSMHAPMTRSDRFYNLLFSLSPCATSMLMPIYRRRTNSAGPTLVARIDLAGNRPANERPESSRPQASRLEGWSPPLASPPWSVYISLLPVSPSPCEFSEESEGIPQLDAAKRVARCASSLSAVVSGRRRRVCAWGGRWQRRSSTRRRSSRAAAPRGARRAGPHARAGRP